MTKNLAVILLVFFSSKVLADEYHYKFKLLSIPVASLTINGNSLNIKNEKTEFELNTEGPLKIYRSYKTRGHVRRDSSDSWEYYLSGTDRGKPEEKLILFSKYESPYIKIFIDDAGSEPITINQISDKNLIDPFSVLFLIVEQLENKNQCDNEFHVIDGKRRYNINSETIYHDNLNINDIHCQLTMTASKSSVSKDKTKIWPFNNKKRIIDIWFSRNIGYMPSKFKVKTPIGTILGDLYYNN